MQLHKDQAVDINFRDLIFHLLYRWRSILLAALIGAVVLGGYQYLGIKCIHDAGKQTREERQYQLNLQNYRENLEGYENTIRINTRLLEGQNAYRSESIYFQLDPQAVWTASNKYLVKVDRSVLDQLPQGSAIDPADSILSTYTAPLSEATDEEMKKAFGTEKPEYVAELVATETSSTVNTVKVTVKAATKEQARAGMALLNEKMEALAAGKAQNIEKHTLSLVSEEVKLGADEQLQGKQEALAKSIKENQEALQEARKKYDELQASGEPGAPGMHLAKMGVLGFFLGAVAVLFLYAALYIFRGRINHANEVSVRYRVPIFGEIPKAGNLHACRGLDKLLARWELGKDPLDADAVYDNAAALVSRHSGIETVLLLSSLPQEKLVSVHKAMAARLPETKVEAKAEMLRSSDTIDEAAKAGAVILVEERHVSRIKEVDRMAEALMISQANVIGAILL